MKSKDARPSSASEIEPVTLKGLLLEQLGRIQDGEMHLASEVPEFIERVSSPSLKSLLRDWLGEIREDDIVLREIAKALGAPVLEGTSCAVRSVVRHEREQLKKLARGRNCDLSIANHAIEELEHQRRGYEAAAAYAGEIGETWSGRTASEDSFIEGGAAEPLSFATVCRCRGS